MLRQFALLPEGEIRELDGSAQHVHRAVAEREREEELLQDPPDEFKDSLMDTLMEDPVILPASKAVLDRSTINRRPPAAVAVLPAHACCCCRQMLLHDARLTCWCIGSPASMTGLFCAAKMLILQMQGRTYHEVYLLCRILLSDAMDPLTRTPLKEEDLIPDAALKTRIEAWKAEMRQKAFEKARQQ